MLRMTISRIRRVCSASFIPRILRVDQCSATVSSAVIRKAHKSTTKVTGDGEKASTDKSNDVVPDYKCSITAELKIDEDFRRKIGEDAGLTDKTANVNKQPILQTSLPLTHRERCQKIIDEAFGKVSNTQHDQALNEQYFSHTVNLEDTRRKIHESEKAKLKLQELIDNPLLTDNRSQYSIFKMSRELNLKDDNRDDIIVTDTAPAREPDFSKNLENVKGTAEETPLVVDPNVSQAKEDFDKCVNNPESIERKTLCDNDAETIEVIKDEREPHLYQKAKSAYQLPCFVNATTAREPKLPHAKEDVNDNQESVEKKPKTIKSVKDERTQLHQVATPNDQPHLPHVLNTTTAKEEEELLTQKLETIEETPVVEAHKPKLEGFNVTPKVLGNEPSTLNCKIVENNKDKSSRLDFPEALDEVSKRCLNCPLGQIDEMLINEMEKLGMTCRSTHKGPSTPMEDDLVQMDILNKQPISAIEDQKMLSESPRLEEKKNERATDSRTPKENEQTEALRKSEAISKPTGEDAKDILYPEHIRIQIEPLACKSEEYNPAEDYNSPTKFACYYLPPTLRAAEIKQEIRETLPNSGPIMYSQTEGPLSLDGPIHKGTLSDTPNSNAFINNQNAEPYSIQSVEGDVLGETAQNAQTKSAAAMEETTPAEDINITIASVDLLHDASDNIRMERLLKPEYSIYCKGAERSSYYATMNAPKSVGDETRTPAEREFDKFSFYSGNLTVAHVHKASASKYENEHQTFPKEMDEAEHYGQTPTQQSTTEVQGELQQKQITANRLFVKVPQHTNFRLPGENCNKKCEYSATADEITLQWSKPEGDPEKASLPEEILKEHTLDPYYVLTCNETCPISPGSSMSRNQNMDFVDTTETLYLKKNICESIRPKPQPIVKSANISSDTHVRPNVLELENPMPKVGEQMALSDLLRKVRERSRFSNSGAQSSHNMQAVGKCGRKSPRCLPTAPRSPPTDPIPLPTFGLPKLKRRPPVCKPVKKPSSTKCSSCTINDGGIYPVMPYVLYEAEVCAVISKVNLTDEVIDRLQNLGQILGVVLQQAKSNIEILLAKDYEPWTPIPSWKIPQKTVKEWQPGKHGVPPCVDGCPVFPKARASMNPEPPCNLKPCEGFPKRNSFSMLDCFTVSMGENKVYDLGEF